MAPMTSSATAAVDAGRHAGTFPRLDGSAVARPILSLAASLSDASEQVSHYAASYFSIRIWSAPFALLNLALLGWLLGRQQPKAAMWQLIIANCANIALDLLFVIGLGWGVEGAALASVIADMTACAVACTMVLRQLKLFNLPPIAELLGQLHPRDFGRLLSLNLDIFIRSLCLQATFAFMTFKGAGLGDETVAANAVLLNMLLLISYALDGIATMPRPKWAAPRVKNTWTRSNRRFPWPLVGRPS